MSVSWSQHGWQPRPSWKYSRVVCPAGVARSKVLPSVVWSLMGGALAPGPGSPTLKAYRPAAPCWSPPLLATRKTTSSTTTARPTTPATLTPPGRPPRRRRIPVRLAAAGRRSGLPAACGRLRPDGFGALVLIGLLLTVDMSPAVRARPEPAHLPQRPPAQQPRRHGQQ